MNVLPPNVGNWYSVHGGELFEVVAIDEADGTIEVQYFDGTLEEIEMAEWKAQCSAGGIEAAEAPEDWSGSVDVDREDEDTGGGLNDDRKLNAMGQDGLDLFE